MGQTATSLQIPPGIDAGLIRDLYHRWRRDPGSVAAGWQDVFHSIGDELDSLIGDGPGADGPSWAVDPMLPELDELGRPVTTNGAAVEAPVSGDMIARATRDSIGALLLIRSYRVRGHLEADLDPLGLARVEPHPELDPATYGFGPQDWDREIFLNGSLGFHKASLREIYNRLRATYCGTIGVEFMHIQEPDQKAWIQERIEAIENRTEFTDRGRRAILERLTAAEVFEQFLHKKYTGTKRFGLDGGEAMIPAIEQILKRGGQLGLEEVVIGMAHRGRLNMLANVMGKPFSAIFSEFQGSSAHPDDVQGSGDVKYHLGTSSDRDFDGNNIHLSLTANPSHLEAVNPVVAGKVRAKQKQRGDSEREKVLALLLHGDAAFAGQGLVAETLMMSDLRGYRIGGTIHFIINNQIGFTTNPVDSRSGPYSTDVAKAVQAPIFHVNGDDPEAVVHVARIATEFRQKFKTDVVIDMFCYRRFGHNEGDEPSFTQPVMYRAIEAQRSVREQFAERLERERLIEEGEGERFRKEMFDRLDAEFEAASSYRPNKADWLEGKWSGLQPAGPGDRRGKTGVPEAELRQIGDAITRLPEGFTPHSKIDRVLKQRRRMLETGEGFDWAMAEALAFGTLCQEGIAVRLSGQDSGRGTFSQRHAAVYDFNTAEKIIPLQHISESQASFEVHDSPLSEAGVLGFEYGFTLAEPHALVLWEAQFGDFVNGAQVIIDQFISSAEAKWLRMSGLVMLLPHGYEGQGPEHSSARPERFLQSCAEDNMQVANCTTPANYFHILRRQIHRDFRKPLVIMTPKSLLRHKLCVSAIGDFTNGSSFHRVIPETDKLAARTKVKRVVLCSGKVYYDLHQERAQRGIEDIALVRLEQLYPFPTDPLGEELAKYPNAEIVWCQEEPENMGAWSFVDRRIEKLLTAIGHKAARPVYVGRAEAASPATGMLKRHNQQQSRLIDDALTIN